MAQLKEQGLQRGLGTSDVISRNTSLLYYRAIQHVLFLSLRKFFFQLEAVELLFLSLVATNGTIRQVDIVLKISGHKVHILPFPSWVLLFCPQGYYPKDSTSYVSSDTDGFGESLMYQ